MAPGADGHARAEVLGPRVAVESPAQEDVEPATLRVLGAESSHQRCAKVNKARRGVRVAAHRGGADVGGTDDVDCMNQRAAALWRKEGV